MPEAHKPLPPAGWSRRGFLASLLGAGIGLRRAEAANEVELAFAETDTALELRAGSRQVLGYQRVPPSGGRLTVESACYLHPLTTPAGTVVTEVAPDDHRHHRGVFTGWVEVGGAGRRGDFWGWGEPAPVRGRRIVNRDIEAPAPVLGVARFRALNEWWAEDHLVLKEDARVLVYFRPEATLVNIVTQFTPTTDLTLGRWAFGGFAVRTPREGATAIGPDGVVRLPAPHHRDPSRNWPDRHWYGLHLKPPGAAEATVAVANHSRNPPTTWHVVPSIGLINPCITGAGPVTIPVRRPLVLRYQVMAFDGPPNQELLNELGASWHAGESRRG